MHYITHKLQNGLRIIHMPVDSPVFYCGFGVNAGTRDEDDNEHGLAHFVEHMLFKGTTKRRSWHILNRMENVGGELNAYTTKEETFVYSVFMEEHFSRALELLTDLVFNSRFPEKEIEKEVDVILDEINSYEDSPAELIYDEFENILFEGHTLGHNILGDAESLKGFTTDSGCSFLKRFYTPDNMIFFSMGRKEPAKLLRIVEQMVGNITMPQSKSPRYAPADVNPAEKRVRKDTHQSHVLLGGRAYSMYDPKRIILFLLNNIIGGPGMNSRLNLALREKHGLVYTVESSISSYTDSGFASIYFGTDHKHLDKALHLVDKTITDLRDRCMTATQLAAAKKQVMGQLAVARDNREGLFLGMGKSFLHHDRHDSLPEIFAKIEKITSEDILKVANEVYAKENLFSLIYQ